MQFIVLWWSEMPERRCERAAQLSTEARPLVSFQTSLCCHGNPPAPRRVRSLPRGSHVATREIITPEQLLDNRPLEVMQEVTILRQIRVCRCPFLAASPSSEARGNIPRASRAPRRVHIACNMVPLTTGQFRCNEETQLLFLR